MKNANKQPRRWRRLGKRYTALYASVCTRIRPRLGREMNVLELACGTGQLSIPLCGAVRLWEATDSSPEMIVEAKKEVRSCRLYFSVQDAACLPYADETFDAVVIGSTLHALPDPESVLLESFRVLKPGGLLFAPTFLCGQSRGTRLRAYVLARISDFTVYHPWNAEDFLDFIGSHGFSVLDAPMLGARFLPLCCLAAEKPCPDATAL